MTLRFEDPTDEGQWLEAEVSATAWSVGALIPNRFDGYVRIHSPAPDTEDWWSQYQALYRSLLVTLVPAMNPPDLWFALRDGHACDSVLSPAPMLERPNRTYRIVTGQVDDLKALLDSNGRWINPDMAWPSDRSWFVATDVDFWSLYVGASRSYLADVEQLLGTQAETVHRDFEPPLER